jgi:hypothetical protein
VALSETMDRSWRGWALLGLATIWLSVIVISLGSPDLVSGSEQEALPLAAFVTWFWGIIGTAGFLWGMSRLRWQPANRSTWAGVSLIASTLWVAAALVAVLGPVIETGSDPTQLPIWALGAPALAAGMTGLVAVVAEVFSQTPPPGES